MTIATRLLRREPAEWTEPLFTMPLLIDAHELRPLGEARGVQWFTHRLGELSTARSVVTDRTLPPGPILRLPDNGIEPRYVPLRVHRPGSYSALLATPSAKAKPETPARVVDALDGFGLLTRRDRNGVRRTRGPAEIMARLESRGVRLPLSADRSAVVLVVPPGPYLAVAEACLPLIFPFMRDGRPPACAVTAHNPPREAVTVSAGGAVWCGQCQP